MLLGSHHNERYAEMVEEINLRQVDFWFYRGADVPKDEELDQVVDLLISQFMHVGPFGSHFVKEYQGNLKSMFYGIPLQQSFITPALNDFDALGFVATNAESSILMKTAYDFLRAGNIDVFNQLKLSVLAVHRAKVPNQDAKIVLGMDCLTDLRPLSYYEHPTNGRLLLAMEGDVAPDHTALLVHGQRFEHDFSTQDLYMDATVLYNDYEMGNMEKEELSTELFHLLQG